MKDLSVIIVSYNTKDLTFQCISKLRKALEMGTLSWEIIIVDNNSTDGTQEKLRESSDNKKIKSILNKDNKGFGKANNQGLAIAEGRYVLYLNSDVLVPEEAFFDTLVADMDTHPLQGAMTVRVQFPTGSIDPASHRGFPTVWRSFCYFSKLELVTKHIPLLNTLFGGYHLTHLSLKTRHEIDSPTGAFFLARKEILDTLQGFDEDFFMYGEDLDLALRIKRMGYSIIYNPVYTVLHLKYQSGIKKKNNTKVRSKTKGYFYESMAIFYKKHYEKLYPAWISALVYAAIAQKKAAV